MAGTKKNHTEDMLPMGKKAGNPLLDEHTGTSTLATPNSIYASRTHPGSTGPFNFESLTSQYKIGIIKNGITKTQLEAIKSETDFDYHTLSNLLAVSRKPRESLIDRPGKAAISSAHL
jgi:hypothetical protein